MLDGTPAETLAYLLGLVGEGVPLQELSATVAYAAAWRVAHFHTSNDFLDWDTVHQAFTYANAVDRAMRRHPSPLLARGIFDGSMAIYLERFLNVPKQPLPATGGAVPSRADLLWSFDRQGQVNETATLLAGVMASGDIKDAIRMLGHAMLREDSGFHQFQSYEAAVRQAEQFGDSLLSRHILLGAARYLAAHSPTARAGQQTCEVAARLHRGESLHGEV